MYKEFGEWCRMTLKAYQEADMSPDYLSMMNEPDGDNSAGTKIRLGYGIDDSQKRITGKHWTPLMKHSKRCLSVPS